MSAQQRSAGLRPLVSPGRRTTVLVVLCLALAAVMASLSLVNVALPAIAGQLAATQTDAQWIADGYALTFAALLLPAGAIGDRFGRRLVLVAGLLVFAAASGAAAYAPSADVVIWLRAVAGAGAAFVMPATLAIITTVFPERERARAVGVWAGVASAGGALGLVVSGAMLHWFWWGSVFLVAAGAAIVPAVLAVLLVPETTQPQGAGTDWLGAVLSILGLTGLVFGLIEGPARGWGDSTTLTGLITGVVMVAVFVWWQTRSAAPLLDPRLFRHRGFAVGTLVVTVLFFATLGLFFVIVQYWQYVAGYSPLTSGVALAPLAVLMAVAAPLAPALTARLGARSVFTAGLMVAAAGFVVLAQVDTGSPYWFVATALAVIGAGSAVVITPATTAITESLPAHRQGVASAVNDVAREVGGVLGIAALGSALTAGYQHSISPALSALPGPAADAAHGSLAAVLTIADRLGPTGDALAAAGRAAFVDGVAAVCWVAAAVLVLGAAATCRWTPKRRANRQRPPAQPR